MRDPRARKNAKFQSARAAERVLLVFFGRAGGQAPQLWEAWPSARARARALSTNQNCKITTFLLVNFKNDHGKSCSVSRDWQPPKISAQSVPISQTYDQKPDFCKFKKAHHFSSKECLSFKKVSFATGKVGSQIQSPTSAEDLNKLQRKT